MKLYTVFIFFEDKTVGIGQYLAENSNSSLLRFIKESESLQKYNREQLITLLIKRKNPTIQVAMKIKGLWIIDFGTDLVNSQEFSSILGGYIVQSDQEGPIRN